MLTKQEHISYWTKAGNESWESADFCFKGGRYVDALFFYCLAIEKYLKANYVLDNITNQPPRIHELQAIYSQTEVQLNSELIDYLDNVNRWNLEGRYPDYKFSLHKLATAEYMHNHLIKLNKLRSCLLERL
jgi:HEPN domain-containing protein